MSDYCKWFIININNNEKYEVEYKTFIENFDKEYAYVYDEQNRDAGRAQKVIEHGEYVIQVHLYGIMDIVASRELNDLKVQKNRKEIIDIVNCTNKGDFLDNLFGVFAGKKKKVSKEKASDSVEITR